MKISVIISTYNHPKWLEKVLWGFECQTHKDFEILIADDGSGQETRDLVNQFIEQSALEIIHVWHEDQGYQKCQILNKAIQKANTDYLLFTDGDCIPRKDFVEVHVKNAEKGYYLSGGAIRLPMSTSENLTREDIISERAFQLGWLLKNGLENKPLKNLKLVQNKTLTGILNRVTPANASWNGGNASGWKENLEAINGFDERMEYGGQDRELGERLDNLGLKSKQLRYSAICLHLEHSRGYKNQKSIDKNKNIRKITCSSGVTWTDFGIVKEENI